MGGTHNSAEILKLMMAFNFLVPLRIRSQIKEFSGNQDFRLREAIRQPLELGASNSLLL